MESKENVENIEVAVAEAKPKKTSKPKKANKQIKITLIKSACSSKPNQRKTVEALGLKKINATKVVDDSEAIRGMIFAVKHLVKVEEL